MCVIGSSAIFSDEWVVKEQNDKLEDYLIQLCSRKDKISNLIKRDVPDISEHRQIPDIPHLSDRLKSCLQESENIPKDFSLLFDKNLFQLNNDLVPEVIDMYNTVNIKHEPLSLIPPQFECPLPPLQLVRLIPNDRHYFLQYYKNHHHQNWINLI